MRAILALVLWNIRSIGTRVRSAAVVVTGFFGVIVVFAAVLSIRAGLERAMSSPDGDGIAVTFAHEGALGPDALSAVTEAPGVARVGGVPAVSAWLVTSFVVSDWKPGLFSTDVLIGVDSHFAAVMPGFRIIKGRMFRSGFDEVLVGRGAEHLFPGLSLGHVLHWNHRDWKVVGVFSLGERNADSQFLTDLHQLQSADNAGNSFTDATARLVSAAAFPAFKAAVEHRPGLAVTVETLRQRNRDFSGTLDNLLLLADGVITALMAVGAIFGMLNVMYANVARRSAELAMLRALGFARLSILAAVLSEALFLALLGGGLGVIAAYLIFDGWEASTEAGSLIDFQFAVTPQVAAAALALAAIMGAVGGLFPAIRAARLPLARALRAA